MSEISPSGILVIEGPDGSGKSTLLKSLSMNLKKTVFHTGGPKRSKEELRGVLDKINTLGDSVLLDRVPYVSECIYPKSMGGRSLITERLLLEEFLEKSPKIVYCRLSSPAEMFRNISKEKKQHKSLQHLEEVMRNYMMIVEEYDRIMKFLDSKGAKILRYDWKSDSVQKVIQFLEGK